MLHKDWAWRVSNMQLLAKMYNQLSLNHWSDKCQTVNQSVNNLPHPASLNVKSDSFLRKLWVINNIQFQNEIQHNYILEL